MQEAFLHYIWRFLKFDQHQLRTTQGEAIHVFQTGQGHHHAGPDFRNARLRIGSTVWAGNVEIHLRASDWFRHKHQDDPNYDSVILHVVYEADQQITRKAGAAIPTLELKGRIPARLQSRYLRILSSRHWIPCLESFPAVGAFHKEAFKSRLLIDRLEYRCLAMEEVWIYYRKDWQQTFFHVVASAFGMPTNKLPFEMLARSLPLKLLHRHRTSLFQIEALVFGQAGLLQNPSSDTYQQSLALEYIHLARKFSLHAIDPAVWHFLRMRPAGFPTVRLAQFAALWFRQPQLLSAVKEIRTLEELEEVLNTEVSSYWKTHYRFGEPGKSVPLKAGPGFVNRLIANALIPFLFFYLGKLGREEDREYLQSLISALPPEENKVLENWKKLGMRNDSAFDSQALLHWKKYYCEKKKCLECRVGQKILEIKEESDQ